MQNISIPLTAGQALPAQVRGTTLQIIDADTSADLQVQFMLGSQVQYTVTDVQTGWKLTPAGGFDSLVFLSSTGATITGIVTAGDIDIQLLQVSSEISNNAANPVPVSIISDPAAPFQVSAPANAPVNVAVQGSVNVTGASLTATNVGINNTSANPVPTQALPAGAAVTDAGVSAVGTATGAAAVLAAAAGRKRVIFRNTGAGQLAITASNATTFAQAAIVLQPGDAWKETDAPQLAWYAISDVGTNVAIQTVS